ncbi:glyceraldehyde-3-phosphate dehydrogenase 1 [Striga asiatica]|uniref:Glyceraldehyde-3-phosphate dehydrogenase 1 n=1 Tax=Striga asiatica TaxID=4170 RepID=A0A5A7R7I4_STRAF|nr:glyceraldehyde-3-phosphate dehydrogenase 1 [Striga asiatica]
MNFSSQFLNFLVILKESVKLLIKNGKIMALVTALSLFSFSVFSLLFDLPPSSLTQDMLARESLIPILSSNSSEFSNYLSRIKNKFPLLAPTLYIVLVFSYSLVTFLSTIATVIVSAESHKGNVNFSAKELCSSTMKSCIGSFVTGFYTTILVIGYVFLVLTINAPLRMSSNMSTLGWAVLFTFFAYVFYLYLSSIWILSLVVSVVDRDCSGIRALGKSAEIIKGQELSGFLLNVVMNLASWGVYLGSMNIKSGTHWISNEKIKGLISVGFTCLVWVLNFVVYTVLYFRGKEGIGQEIELNLSNVEYAKLGNDDPLVGVA